MKDMNKVFLLGRMGADPEVRTTKNGLAFAKFSLATARRVKDPNGSDSGVQAWMDETQWHRVVAWGRMAETVQKLGRKGQTVLIEGTIRNRKYETQDGKPQFSFEVHADEMSFLGLTSSASRSSGGSQAGESAAVEPDVALGVSPSEDLPY
jgi:single-strand DNA-binding protein